MKRFAALLTVFVLLWSCACGEVFEGVTVSYTATPVTAAAGGLLREWNAEIGQCVTEGMMLGATEVTRVYATQDGTVSRVEYKAGEQISTDPVISLTPVSRYLIYCSTSGAYNAVDNKLVHIGETVYVKCRTNGTHMGIGRIISIDGEDFNVEMLGGELYVGEVVYMYRKSDLSAESRIGEGTVVESDDETYTSAGTVVSVDVTKGQRVSRGQLLYTYAADAETTLTVPCDGIITAVKHQRGDSLKQDETVAEVTAYSDILLKITLSEENTGRVSAGTQVTYSRSLDSLEEPHNAVVKEISSSANEDGTFTVWLIPEDEEHTLGMTVTVYLDLE